MNISRCRMMEKTNLLPPSNRTDRWFSISSSSLLQTEVLCSLMEGILNKIRKMRSTLNTLKHGIPRPVYEARPDEKL